MGLKERLSEGWIHCSVVIELLGKPKEYAEQVMSEVIDAISKMEGVEMINKTVHEPVEAKNDMFSTFSEVELAVKNINILTLIVFSYMPSNIEILSPKDLKISLRDANEYLNMLTSRLHGYDSVAKRLRLENMILKRKLQNLGELPKDLKEVEEVETIKKEEAKAEEESKEKKE